MTEIFCQDGMLHAKFGMATWKNFSLMKISPANRLCRREVRKKSDIIHCLEDEVDTEDTNPLSDVVVLDGAATVL